MKKDLEEIVNQANESFVKITERLDVVDTRLTILEDSAQSAKGK